MKSEKWKIQITFIRERIAALTNLYFTFFTIIFHLFKKFTLEKYGLKTN